MKWVEFEQEKLANQKLPPRGRYILCQIAAKPEKGLPPAVAVGYMRFAAGDKNSPVFTIPGVGGDVVAWCDCLDDDFAAPLWKQRIVIREEYRMKAKDIEKAEQLASAIRNFRECYSQCVLHGSSPDYDVKAAQLIEWLIENPHMAQIADDIKRYSV